MVQLRIIYLTILQLHYLMNGAVVRIIYLTVLQLHRLKLPIHATAPIYLNGKFRFFVARLLKELTVLIPSMRSW